MKIWKLSLVAWLHKKIADPLLQILKKGAEPRQLALSTAVGTALGVFPIFGLTVFLCGVAIALLRERCHAPTIMLTNFVVTPIELSLVIPFLRLGESISGGPHFPLTKDALKLVATGEASSEVLVAVLHALVGWLVASPFMFGTTYVISLPCFKFLVQKFKPPASPKQALYLDAPDIKIKVRDL
ncbi:hypothetical protein LUZ61_020836 [Rhynchospora tenuis]|uniref:DUF2062 domain-containing protein n=1 Tax=Rhynchospora tenuis TaxID=198213 RepID=A0AAD5ZDR9_9POAL|nr:hypothetical protein LUZ61_020836 [Rhynchospora tenuis]